MSVLSTTPYTAVPSAAAGINVSAGAGAWTYGAWTELVPLTSAPTAIVGVHLAPSSAPANSDMELAFGTGGVGAEGGIGHLRLHLHNPATNTLCIPAGLYLPVPLGLPAGVRLAARMRASTGSFIMATTLQLAVAPSSSQITGPTQQLTSAPSGATSPTITPSATPWAPSAWVELLPSAATAIGLAGLVHGVVAAGAISGVEYDLGTGALGAETVITTLREAHSSNTKYPHTWLPGLFPVSAGTRVSVRLRKAGTSVTAYPVALLYYTDVS